MNVAWRTVLALASLAGCGEDTVVQPVGDLGVSRVFHQQIPITYNANIDVLFVIDSSPAMAAFETKLAQNYRELIQLLTPAFGPDLHVGVVTADPADAGTLRMISGVAGSFITTTLQFDGSVQTNVTGPIDDAFAALASVGSAGSTSVQLLAMAQAALAPGANPGFIRTDAYLGIVFVTAGDDSSAGAAEDYASAFKQLKADPSNVIVSTATGPCSVGSLSAPEAPRLATFVGKFPNRGTQVAICEDRIDALVSLEGQLIKTTLGAPCIDAPLASPTECAVWLRDAKTSQQRIVEPCPSSSIPCWSLVTDPGCIAPPSLSLRLAPANFRPAGSVIEEIECVIE